MNKYKVNKDQERINVQMIKRVGLLMGINNTLKKINEHGKENKKPARVRHRPS